MIFASGAHDFGALVVSVRHKAKNIGTLASEVISKRSRIPTLISDSRRRGRGWLSALGAAIHGPAYAAIIVDGDTVSSGGSGRGRAGCA